MKFVHLRKYFYSFLLDTLNLLTISILLLSSFIQGMSANTNIVFLGNQLIIIINEHKCMCVSVLQSYMFELIFAFNFCSFFICVTKQ